MHSLISSHLSLSPTQKRGSSLLRKKEILSHTCGRKLLNLKLQPQIQTLTSVDHHISSSELHCRSIWTSSEGHIFCWWNQVDPTVDLRDIVCPSFDDEAAYANVVDLGFATADINQSYCTISLC